MTNPPERIWFTPWDDGEENGTAGPARHTEGKPPNGDATEYIRNDPAAMRGAGYVPVTSPATEGKYTFVAHKDAPSLNEIYRQYADVYNKAIEEAARIVDPAVNAKDGLWASNLRKKAAAIRALKGEE